MNTSSLIAPIKSSKNVQVKYMSKAETLKDMNLMSQTLKAQQQNLALILNDFAFAAFDIATIRSIVNHIEKDMKKRVADLTALIAFASTNSHNVIGKNKNRLRNMNQVKNLEKLITKYHLVKNSSAKSGQLNLTLADLKAAYPEIVLMITSSPSFVPKEGMGMVKQWIAEGKIEEIRKSFCTTGLSAFIYINANAEFENYVKYSALVSSLFVEKNLKGTEAGKEKAEQNAKNTISINESIKSQEANYRSYMERSMVIVNGLNLDITEAVTADEIKEADNEPQTPKATPSKKKKKKKSKKAEIVQEEEEEEEEGSELEAPDE